MTEISPSVDLDSAVRAHLAAVNNLAGHFAEHKETGQRYRIVSGAYDFLEPSRITVVLRNEMVSTSYTLCAHRLFEEFQPVLICDRCGLTETPPTAQEHVHV